MNRSLSAQEPTESESGRPASTRRKGAQALQSLLDEALDATLKAKGFASSAIHLHWSEIVGRELAQWSEPVTLKWPPRPPGADPEKARDGATLTIKVEGAFALDLQHQTPQVIQRVNSFFGWRCVEKLVLKQGPVRKGLPEKKRRKPELTVEASKRLDQLIQPVDDPDLKKALARLGLGVLGRK